MPMTPDVDLLFLFPDLAPNDLKYESLLIAAFIITILDYELLYSDILLRSPVYTSSSNLFYGLSSILHRILEIKSI